MLQKEQEPKPEIIIKLWSPKDQQDIDCVNKVVSGDRNAFIFIFNKYWDIMYQKYWNQLRTTRNQNAVTEDLTIELFEKVFVQLKNYEPIYTFNSWITKIAKHHFIDHIRKNKIDVVSIDVVITNDDDSSYTISITDTFLTPDKAYEKIEMCINMAKAMDKLDEKSRDILHKRYFEELSYEEISVDYDVPIGTVKNLIFRAKEKLRKIIEDDDDLCDCLVL